jgi:hypothetical protein
VQVLALCCALVPGLAAAAPWCGALPLGPLAALAGPAGAAAAPPDDAWALPVASRVPAAPGDDEGLRPAQDERLAQMRGGSDAPWSEMKLAGTVASNSAVNVVTGANIVTEGSFSNASGLPMVIQNSGANVLIQNATIINVQFK